MSFKSYPLSVLLHLSAFITYGYSLCWLFLNELPPMTRDVLGGRLRYLTYWDVWIQFITFTIALICDFISNPNNNKNKSKQPFIVKLRDTVFNSLAFPIGAFVTTSFWILYTIDRQLIFPVGIEKWYPIWLNHTTHTIILPIVLIDNYLVCHNRDKQKNGLKILITVSVVYGLWILFLGLKVDHWVYPVLAVLNWPLRVAFMLSSNIAMILFYYLGALCYDIAWKSSTKSRIESRKKLK